MRPKRPSAGTEPPGWFHHFIEAAWADDEEDADLDPVWVTHNRQRRWMQARRQWAADHPDFSPLEDLRRRRAARLCGLAGDVGEYGFPAPE